MKYLSAFADKIRQKAQWSVFLAAVRAFLTHPSPSNLVTAIRSGAVLIAAVVALGVLTIVIPIVYLVSVQVGNTLPAGGLTNGQSSTLATLINNGGAALQRVLARRADNRVRNCGRSRDHPARNLYDLAVRPLVGIALLPVPRSIKLDYGVGRAGYSVLTSTLGSP